MRRTGDPTWDRWLVVAWPALVARRRLRLPASLPHPRAAGFREPGIADPAGQVRDFVRSLPDGSRLHVHELEGGRLVVHRDRTDPANGPTAAAWHWASEAGSARVALAVLLALALSRVRRP